MQNEETIEWIVNGLNNNCYRDIQGPLSRYTGPHDMLTDLEAGSLHIHDMPSVTNEDHRKRNKLGEDVPGRIQCFGCRETGHARRDCPKVKSGKCFKCGQTGHYARDCGKNLGKSSENVSSSTANTNASGSKAVNTFRNTHDKYFKNAILEGYELPSYVDLESSVVPLRETPPLPVPSPDEKGGGGTQTAT